MSEPVVAWLFVWGCAAGFRSRCWRWNIGSLLPPWNVIGVREIAFPYKLAAMSLLMSHHFVPSEVDKLIQIPTDVWSQCWCVKNPSSGEQDVRLHALVVYIPIVLVSFRW